MTVLVDVAAFLDSTTPPPSLCSVMALEDAKTLAGYVSGGIGALIALSLSVARSPIALLPLIFQVQILSQLGKVGGLGGALGAVSHSMRWVIVELPFTFLPAENRNQTLAESAENLAMSSIAGVASAEYSKVQQSATKCLGPTLTAEEQADCQRDGAVDHTPNGTVDKNGCGVTNGTRHAEKMIVMVATFVPVFGLRVG